MRYASDHKSATHAKILDGATRRLKERGPGDLAIAELMKEAGLTHGGFYAHFKSRDALIEDSFRHALDVVAQRWRTRADEALPGEGLAAIVDGYLTKEHRDDVAGGCAFPALGAEFAHRRAPTRRFFAAKLNDAIDLVTSQQAGQSAKAAREAAIGTIATMVGSLLLARAASVDDELSMEILEAGRKRALLEAPPRRTRATRARLGAVSANRARRSRS